jgi:lipopolysaccharide biosynthesis protein
MANILLTEDEYSAVKALHADALSKANDASPRLSAHYQKLAMLHATFLAKEDGRRATRQQTQDTRNQIAQTRNQRRAAALQAAQAKLNEQKGNQGNEKPASSGKK